MIIKDLEIRSEDLKKINSLLEIYCEDGNIYSEHNIEPNEILYSYDINLDNGYKIEATVNSGTHNCFVDFSLLDESLDEIECVFTDDCISNDDIIEFMNNTEYAIRIKEIA